MAWTDEFAQDIDQWDLPPGYAITTGSPQTFEIRDPAGRVLLACQVPLPVGRSSATSFRHLLERLAWQLWVSERNSPMPTMKFWLSSGEAAMAAPSRLWTLLPQLAVAGAAIAAAVLIAAGGPMRRPVQVGPRSGAAPPGVPTVARRSAPIPASAFVIHFGQFLRRDRAEARARLIRTKGYGAVVQEMDGGFTVLSRGYATRALAEHWQQVFSTLGIHARVVLLDGTLRTNGTL